MPGCCLACAVSRCKARRRRSARSTASLRLHWRFTNLREMIRLSFPAGASTARLPPISFRWGLSPLSLALFRLRVPGLARCRRSLVDIWRDPNSFAAFRRKSTCLTGRCGECPHAVICKAGFSAMAHSLTNTLTSTEFCIRQLEQDRIQKAMVGD